MDKKTQQQMYRFHAEYCKALANPRRLEILDLLRSGELNLNTLAERMMIKSPALSQHLAVLKQKGFVSTEKTGRRVCCRVARPKILRACDIFRELLFEEIEEKRKFQLVLSKMRRAVLPRRRPSISFKRGEERAFGRILGRIRGRNQGYQRIGG